MSKSKSRTFAIDDITVDPALQPREHLSQEAIADYVEAMKAGVNFPPIIVFKIGNDYLLAEGFHRVEARKRASLPNLKAEIRTGTRDDAIAWAAASNRSHGQRRTNSDKRRAVEMLLALESWRSQSDRAIADHIGVGNQLVGDVRAQLCDSHSSDQPQKRIGKDGKTRRAKRKVTNREAAASTTVREVTTAADCQFNLPAETNLLSSNIYEHLGRWPRRFWEDFVKSLRATVKEIERDIAATVEGVAAR